MRHYSLLKTIPLSFYSKALYRDVGQEWPGLGFAYLLVAIITMALPMLFWSITMSFTLTMDNPYDINYIINQIPEIHVAKGEISTSVSQPYYIMEKDSGKPLAVIDTAHPVTYWAHSEELQSRKFAIVIGKNEIMTFHTGEKRLYDVAKNMDKTFTRDTVREFIEKLISYAWLLPIFLAPFLMAGFFLYGIVLMFLYGICGLVVNFFLRAGLSYTDCVRLSAVATTPTFFLSYIPAILHLDISNWIGFAIDMGYLFYGIKAARR